MVWLLYIGLCIFHLTMIYLGQGDLVATIKPSLMPALMLVILVQTRLRNKWSIVLIAGVLFGGLGDLLLMYEGELFFGLGLLAFLIGHLIYIYLFAQEVIKEKKTHYLLERPYLILPYIAVWIFCINLLSKHIHNFPGFPIYLYAFVIFLMSIMAINRWYAVSKLSWWTVFLGSLLFIVSDLSLSVKIFITPFENSSLLIMSTYLAAQGLIVFGCLNSIKTKH